MTARNPAELVLFEELDRQRERPEQEEARVAGLAAPLKRLIQENELPQWLRVVDHRTSAQHAVQTQYGRGHRERPEARPSSRRCTLDSSSSSSFTPPPSPLLV